MKKFLSILIFPLVAVLMLCGCGKTQRTIAEVKSLTESSISSYSVAENENLLGNPAYKNWYFKVYTDGGIEYLPRVIYDNEVGLNDFVHGFGVNSIENAKLKTKYTQLRTVYERELNMIFAYYNYYINNFYENAAAKKVTSEELTELYDRAKSFFKQLESFNSSKIDFEREVKLYGNTSNILVASLDKFNYAYNQLVNSSLNFVEYFRDVHYKYFFKDVNIYDISYANQLYYDSLLSLAKFVYKDYLEALTVNGTVSLIDVTNVTSSDVCSFFNIYLNSNFNKIVTDNATQQEFYGSNKTYQTIAVSQISAKFDEYFAPTENSEPNANQAKASEKIKQFETSLKTFKQYYELYLKAMNKLDINEYNELRFHTKPEARMAFITKLAEAKTTETLVKYSNISIAMDFENYKVNSFVNAINGMISFK